MKKILMVDNCDNESTIGDTDDIPDEHIGGDSSKSNSITSEHSLQSIGMAQVSGKVSSISRLNFLVK